MFNFVNKRFSITLRINIAYPTQQTKPKKKIVLPEKMKEWGVLGTKLINFYVC
jgi:hypothetical protein